jgi:hypothetical protein
MATNVPNPGAYLNSISVLLTTIRDRLQQVIDQNGYIASMGGVTFLTTPAPDGLGMSPGDANALIAAMGNHTAVATGYAGGPPAPQLNYKQNGEPFWGGM